MRTAGQRARLPRSLKEIARRRLELVGGSCRQLLGSAAVIGRAFEVDLLTAAHCAPATAVVDQLAEAASAGLVEEIGTGRFQFAHALLREALYLDLPPNERAAAHARVAAAIGGLGPVARRSRIDSLAYHLRHALPIGSATVALAATVEAAEADEAALAFEQAADGYAEALTLVQQDAATGHSRSELLLRQARCHERAGAVVAAWQASQRAAAAARAENNGRALAEAALVMRGLVDPAIAGSLFVLCQEALRVNAGVDPVVEARLLAQMSVAAGSAPTPAAEPGLGDTRHRADSNRDF